MGKRVLVACALALALAVTACSALLSIDNYRACRDQECADGSAADAPVVIDEGVDAGPDVVSGPCMTSADCTMAPAIVCSNQKCASITTLVEGSSGFECVILSDETMECWGANDHGQLGRGAIGGQYDAPRPVSVLSGDANHVTQVAMGDAYACALTKTGDVYCWGDGKGGSGSGTATKVSLPAQTASISGGPSAACALLVDSSVYCWGDNDYGDIGCVDGGALPASAVSPRLLVDKSLGAEQVAVGLQGTCVRTNEGNGNRFIRCYGNSAWGILGDGTPQGLDNGCQTSKFSGFATNGIESITNSDFVACAKDINAQFYCWGMNYVFYGVGLIEPANNAAVFTTPHKMAAFSNPNTKTKISMGWLHGCILDKTGTVLCWGGSSHRETGFYMNVAGPTKIILPPASQIAAHRQFTCALLESGNVMCWGNNETQSIGPLSLGPDPGPTAIKW